MKVPFSRFVVCDRSMEPAFFEGDHVLTFNWVKPKVGDVIVFQSGKIYIRSQNTVDYQSTNECERANTYFRVPEYLLAHVNLKKNTETFQASEVYKIKRVIKTPADLIFVAGDNKKLSSQEKPVERQNVIGKIILKY